jgi:hypothetical protein
LIANEFAMSVVDCPAFEHAAAVSNRVGVSLGLLSKGGGQALFSIGAHRLVGGEGSGRREKGAAPRIAILRVFISVPLWLGLAGSLAGVIF